MIVNHGFIFFIISSGATLSVTKTSTQLRVDRRFAESALIQQLFQMLRKLIIYGDSSKGIPVLDPWNVEGDLDLASKFLSIHTETHSGLLEGLGGFKVLQSDFNKKEISLLFAIEFFSVRFHSGNYKMSGHVYNEAFPLNGEGNLDVTFHELRLWGKVYLKQSLDGKSILLDRFENHHLSLGKVTCKTEFDGNIDGVANSMIEDLTSAYINRFEQQILKLYSDRFVELVNHYLGMFETWRIMALMLM